MEKAIQDKGVTLAYQVFGDGKPVVLIHGVAEDGNIWQQQVMVLQNDFKLIVPDLPGSGRSVANGDFSMEALADAVQAILEGEEIPEAVIIGHSMGGYVALSYA
jgi:pimeloyl-ACP methyl ester carboxylesterase